MKRILLLLLLLLALSAGRAVAAQAPEPPPLESGRSGALSWWVSVGASRMADPMFLGTSVSVSAGRRDRALRLSYDSASTFKETETLNAASVSLGVRTRVGPLHLGAFVGPAVVWGQSGYDAAGRPLGERYLTAGAAVDASALLGLGSRVALGVGAWANVNPRLSTFGAGPALRIILGGER